MIIWFVWRIKIRRHLWHINNVKVLAEWCIHTSFFLLFRTDTVCACVCVRYTPVDPSRRKESGCLRRCPLTRVDHVIPFASYSSSSCTTSYFSVGWHSSIARARLLPFPFFYFLILQMDITWDNGDRPNTGRTDLSYRGRAGCAVCYSRRCWPAEQNPGACKGYDLPFLMHVTALFDYLFVVWVFFFI